MVQQAPARRPRQATPERWQAALGRAVAERVQVRQLAHSGAWVATSGTDAALAYQVDVTNGIAHGCTCEAGQHNDPVCKHRAMYYHLVGMLDLAEPVECAACGGEGAHVKESATFPGTSYRVTCRACTGRGTVAPPQLRPVA